VVVTALLGLRDGVAFEGTAKLAWINVTVRPRVSHLPPGVGLKISLDHVQCHLDLQQLPAHGVRGGRELIGLTVAKEQFDLGLEQAEVRKAAADALGSMGTVVATTLTALDAVRERDPDPKVRQAATAAWKKIRG